jgi:hypothetical protein
MFGLINGQAINDTDVLLYQAALLGDVVGQSRSVAYNDFTAQVGDTINSYALDLITPTGTVRAPISSWQATLQTGRSNYVQVVIPAVLPLVDAINVATEFSVIRSAVLPDGSSIEYEMARAPTQVARFDRGPARYTCTMTGYSPGFATDEEPSSATDRTLPSVRSISTSSGGVRVRCGVDWLLRPGQRAIIPQGGNFIAAYINYYVGNNDAYMDVGERN